jgi:glycosyltransferase involved in cell wall biosynthesis
MNIVIVGPFGLRPKSTVRRRALPLGKALAARGHRVTVLIPSWDWPPDAGREWQEDGASIRCLPLGSSFPGLSSAALLARLVWAALDIQPEVVHCFKPKAYAGVVAFALWHARGTGLWRGKLVVDSDDGEGPGGWNERGGYSWVQRRLFAWQERWGLRHADGVTVASHMLRALAWSLGVLPQRVHYLPNGVPPWLTARSREGGAGRQRRPDDGDGPVVLCYTRFVGCGPARLAAIVSQVAAQVPLAHFLIVGAGLKGEEREFQARLAEPVCATLAGWVGEEALSGHLSCADLALFPLDDNLINWARCPAKLIDLLAAGVPVVAEAIGEAATYIEHGVSGVLLPPGSHPVRWGEAAAALLGDEVRRRQLGAMAQQRMQEEFAWDGLAEGLLHFYVQ